MSSDSSEESKSPSSDSEDVVQKQDKDDKEESDHEVKKSQETKDVKLKKDEKKKSSKKRFTSWRNKSLKEIDTSPQMTPEMLAKVREKDLYPIQLRFENLSFSVPIPKEGNSIKNCLKKTPEDDSKPKFKTILKNITGTFNPGTITAIMGSSGAGKTTLLNVLAKRAIGKVEGEILYNGNGSDKARTLMKHQAYVMQDDILLKSQTPKEILTFSALLRIPDEYTKEQKLARVQQILEELNILSCQDTQVGAPGEKRGISGGERKRVAIGMELVTNPSLLFLDEPTTGLDSFTAERVIETLRLLAESGRTIICTIHQPNSQIFHKFDQLMLLAKGEMVFCGPASYAVSYFQELKYPCPPFTNPSDHFMKLIHIEQSTDKGSDRVLELIESYKQSPLAKKQKEMEIRSVPVEQVKETHHGYAVATYMQTLLLMKRNLSDTLREPLKIRASMIQTIFLGVLIGLIYLQLDDDQESVQSRSGALFFIMVNQAMTSVVSIVNTYPAERPVFIREHSSHMYRTTGYYLAKVFMDLPFQIIYPLVFSTISYWMIGFQTDFEKYVLYSCDIILVANVGSSIGFVLGVLAKDAGVAVALVPVCVIPFVIFSGFLINTKDVPPYFVWIEYISFVKYGFRALAINEYEDLSLSCNDDEKVGGFCRIPDGETVLNNYGFEDDNVRDNLLILFGMMIGWKILGYLALLWRARTAKATS